MFRRLVELPAVTSPGARVVQRCRELARVSEEGDRLTRPYATPAMARANALVGEWMGDAGLAVRTDAAGNLIGHLPGADPDAGHAAGRLPPGHRARRRRVRRAARRPGRGGVRRAAARARRSRCRSPSTCSASPTRRACASAPRTWGAAPWPGTFRPELFDLRDWTGVTVRDALRAVRRRSRRDRDRVPRGRADRRLPGGAHGAGPRARARGPPGRRGERHRGRVARGGALHRRSGPRGDDGDGRPAGRAVRRGGVGAGGGARRARAARPGRHRRAPGRLSRRPERRAGRGDARPSTSATPRRGPPGRGRDAARPGRGDRHRARAAPHAGARGWTITPSSSTRS